MSSPSLETIAAAKSLFDVSQSLFSHPLLYFIRALDPVLSFRERNAIEFFRCKVYMYSYREAGQLHAR